MKLVLQRIADRGVPDKERLALKVASDTTLSYFVVLDTAYLTPQTINSVPKRAFWFPPKPVKTGDWVILFTKAGTPSERKLEDGTTAHFFFWGQPQVLWNQTGNCAVVMELSDWTTTAYE
jgi:hypothetical protein